MKTLSSLNTRIPRIAALLGACAFLSACAGAPDAGDGTVRMGVILPLGGPKGEFAQNVRRGMELAAERIAAENAGAKRLELVFADTKGDRDELAGIIKGFVARDIKALHAGFTADIAYDIDAFGLLKDSLVNYLCSYPPAAVHSPNGVRIFLNGAQECEMLAKFAEPKKGEERKLMIMGVNDPAGKSCANYLKFQAENPAVKIMEDTFRDGETRFDIFAEQIAMLKSDCVLMYGYGDAAGPACESLKKTDFEGTFAANCGFYESGLKSSDRVAAFEIATAFSLGKVKNPESAAFVAAYEKKYGQKPHWTAAYGHDSVMLVWKALKAADYDAPNARAWLLGKTFEGAIGKISIDGLGDSTGELELVRR